MQRAFFEGWRWIAIVVIASGVLGFGARYWMANYSATASLIRTQAAPRPSKGGTPSQGLSRSPDQTWCEVMRSPEIARRVAGAAEWPLNPERLTSTLQIQPVADSDIMLIRLRDSRADRAVSLVNLYARIAVRCVQEIQSNNFHLVEQSLRGKLDELDQSLASANQDLFALQKSLLVTDLDKETASCVQQGQDLDKRAEALCFQVEMLKLQMNNLLKEISNHHPAILAARQELSEALLRCTEEHPRVIKLRATLASLQDQIAQRDGQIDPDVALNGSVLVQNLYSKLIEFRSQKLTLLKQLEETVISRHQLQVRLNALAENSPQFSRASSKLAALKTAREYLVARQQDAQLSQLPAADSFHILALAQAGEARRSPGLGAAALWGACSGLFGLCLASSLVMLVEITNRRIRSPLDLKRATNLPVLASLRDLNHMTLEEQEQWAFATFMTLKGTLTHSTNEALVCGFISSGHGEGRSTWVALLAGAAARCGYQVLTISAGPAGQVSTAFFGHSQTVETGPGCDLLPPPLQTPSALPLPGSNFSLEPADSGWVWDWQSREQWKAGLAKWKSVGHAAVFLDLPPASVPEAVLLSENFPSLIWLCGRDMADIDQTRTHLETLRCARSQMAGAVFNDMPGPSRARQCQQWATTMIAAALILASNAFSAQAPTALALAATLPQTNASQAFSISSPIQLAEWQQHFTLGAGDVLSINLYEQPDSDRKGLVIGPDGRLNYLQARDVMAAGLTVDELRDQLEHVLARFYRPPLRVIIVPQSYNSKKYFVLGNVVQKGVFPLDRPVTIIEAIAHAQGFVTTTERRSTLMQADLPRSFLIRKGPDEAHQRVPVDFEALFLHGDLNQNIGLAPGDYLYFPQLEAKEMFVLGEVRRPGMSPYTPEMTVLRAIAGGGGFTDRSYRQRVLVVRGSLNHPQTLVVNVAEILKAKAVDIKLEARDIVYVSRKPWYKAEELLDAAITDFVRAAVVTWTGENVKILVK